MTVSFRLGRYLAALLAQWTAPLLVGVVFGTVTSTWQTIELMEGVDDYFARAIEQVKGTCTAPTDPPPSRSPPASGTGPPVAGDGGETG
jgi:hypothetical protein